MSKDAMLSLDELKSSAYLGCEYLQNHIHQNGKFDYLYLADQNSIEKGYNILRHSGTIYAMLEVYEIFRKPEILQSVKKGLRYLLKCIKPMEFKGQKSLAVVKKNKVKLGGVALAVLALAKYIDVVKDRQHINEMRGLIRWIQSVQKEDGDFFPHKCDYPGGEEYDFVSGYYPGEALYALCYAYRIDQQESFLDSAEKGVQYYITVRNRDLEVGSTEHDHWLLYAINHLTPYRPQKQYVDHVLAVARAICSFQHRDKQNPDWVGGFYNPPRSTPTATRIEALCQAYQVLDSKVDQDDLNRIQEAIDFGNRFQLSMQIDSEAAKRYPNPKKARGGFRNSLTDDKIRIDYVQHSISSLLGQSRIAYS